MGKWTVALWFTRESHKLSVSLSAPLRPRSQCIKAQPVCSETPPVGPRFYSFIHWMFTDGLLGACTGVEGDQNAVVNKKPKKPSLPFSALVGCAKPSLLFLLTGQGQIH